MKQRRGLFRTQSRVFVALTIVLAGLIFGGMSVNDYLNVRASTANSVQINAGGGADTPFVADQDFNGGNACGGTNAAIDTREVSHPAPQGVYQTNRCGNFTYGISNLAPNAICTVRLHFAETYWTNAGQRIFNVRLNGRQVLSNFDVLATAAGADKAVVKQFATTADANGKVTIQFITIKDNAFVNGIEVFTGNTSVSIPPSPSRRTSRPGSTSGSNWTMYHNDLARTGYLPSMPDPQQLTSAWQQSLDGKVYAEPLVVGGHVIVATENDTMYSLDATTGKIQWSTHVGTPEPQSQLPCGNIDPLGITGTPIYDPATHLVFAVAEVQGATHTLFGLNIQTGAIKVQRSADLPAMDPKAHQQRAALALWKNMVYVSYGGLSGDCSDYIGTVVGLQTDGQGPTLSYRVPTKREGGIWGTSGPSIDAYGNLYIAVGNGDAHDGTWDHSDSILRLSPTLQLEDGFAPTDWGVQNEGDQDLGSMGSVLLPNNQIFADGKASTGYLLSTKNLGGVGGQLQKQNTCNAFGGAATAGSTIFVPCSSGILQLTIGQGNTINRGWQVPAGINNSPVVGGHTVYSATGGILYALNSQTGAVRTQVNISGSAEHFATPTLWRNFVFVGTGSGISAVTIS